MPHYLMISHGSYMLTENTQIMFVVVPTGLSFWLLMPLSCCCCCCCCHKSTSLRAVAADAAADDDADDDGGGGVGRNDGDGVIGGRNAYKRPETFT